MNVDYAIIATAADVFTIQEKLTLTDGSVKVKDLADFDSYVQAHPIKQLLDRAAKVGYNLGVIEQVKETLADR